MERTCKNCDHIEVCHYAEEGMVDSETTEFLYGNKHGAKCVNWEGWIPVDEELPERRRDVLCICENEQGYHAQFVMWHDNVWIFQGNVVPCKVLAWRELPEYKGSKDEKL